MNTLNTNTNANNNNRDLKLENILLDQDDNVKLCDFGFARHAENRQMLETFCGSLAYSAPGN